jgi:hypothetical protein
VANASAELPVRQAGKTFYQFFLNANFALVFRSEEIFPFFFLLFLASIYFKNFVQKNWAPFNDEDDAIEGDQEEEVVHPSAVFHVPEQDKEVVRSNIVESVIYSPAATRSQLLTALGKIAVSDYPDKYRDLLPKLMKFLTSNDQQALYGALLSLYELVKKYE